MLELAATAPGRDRRARASSSSRTRRRRPGSPSSGPRPTADEDRRLLARLLDERMLVSIRYTPASAASASRRTTTTTSPTSTGSSRRFGVAADPADRRPDVDHALVLDRHERRADLHDQVLDLGETSSETCCSLPSHGTSMPTSSIGARLEPARCERTQEPVAIGDARRLDVDRARHRVLLARLFGSDLRTCYGLRAARGAVSDPECRRTGPDSQPVFSVFGGAISAMRAPRPLRAARSRRGAASAARSGRSRGGPSGRSQRPSRAGRRS